MEVVKFYKTLRRMCHFSLKYQCAGCPLEKFEDCDIDSTTDTETMREIVSIVEDWASKNPPKTRLEDFKEKYPNAELRTDGVPVSCCEHLGYCRDCNEPLDSCEECWNTSIDD